MKVTVTIKVEETEKERIRRETERIRKEHEEWVDRIWAEVATYGSGV